jgi:hypothetical protein
MFVRPFVTVNNAIITSGWVLNSIGWLVLYDYDFFFLFLQSIQKVSASITLIAYLIITSPLMSPLLGHRPSLWITHKEA